VRGVLSLTLGLMFRNHAHVLVFACCLILPVLPASATITATPIISPASTQPVYTPVTITFGATDTGPGPVNYSLAVAPPGGAFQLIHDFNLKPSFVWAQNLVEGAYQLQITARDNTTGEQNSVIIPYTITSRVTGGIAAVTATSHPLVALFSAPACPAGSTMQIVFYPEGNTKLASATDIRPCVSGSMNFLIGGMYASMTYRMNYLVTTNGVTTPGPKALPFKTGAIPSSANVVTSFLKVPPSAATSLADKILLTGCALAYLPYATDLEGNPVWYYAGSETVNEVDRLLPGGTLLVIVGTPNSSTGSGLWGLQTYFQVMQEIDLVGNTVRETNVDRVNEQLPLGAAITDFNHEVIRLPNGHTLAIGSNQQIFPAGTQGNVAPKSIIGDVIVDLDTNLQVAWYWNAFDHDSGAGQLDITRPATLGETCSYNLKGEAQLGCPPVLLTSPANDWLHGNSLQLESDGSLLMSLRHQDWVLDIDYANGTGTGDIFWRMGLDGDFTMLTTGQYPWFSHQHDAEFTLGGTTSLTVLDNGDVRIKEFGGHSRGMALNVDIPNRTVSNAVAQDLGVYSVAEGSAQLLSNGDYMFLAADVPYKSGVVELSEEFTTGGTLTDSEGALTGAYRSFRVRNLYSPANGAGVNVGP
jgi:arylsulfate sulfotransferase